MSEFFISHIKNDYEELNKSIDSCVNKIAVFLQNQNIDKKDLNKFYSSDGKPDNHLLHQTIESIAQILEREDCDKYYESLYPLMLLLQQNFILSRPTTASDDSKISSPSDSSSLLTLYNVNLNSIWETVCFQIEKLIINDMIKNNRQNQLDCERICSQLKFLLQLKGGQGITIWRLFNTTRVCKLEAELLSLNRQEFGLFLEHILSEMQFECKLIKAGYFGTYNVSFIEFCALYVQALKERFESEVTAIGGDVNKLIVIVKCMHRFEAHINQIRIAFPRYMESPDRDDMFDWKNMIETHSGINFLHRNIYDKINVILKELNCFNHSCYSECTPNVENILCCAHHIFNHLENYTHLTILDSICSYLSYTLSANISDFFYYHFKYGNRETILEKYTLLNTVCFVMEKLDQLCVNVNKFNDICDDLTKSITTKHVSILLMNSYDTQYWLLYLKRIWSELKSKLKYYRKSSYIFIGVLSESVQHFSRINIPANDALFVLNNIDQLMFKYCTSRRQLLDNDKHNIFNSCWLILIKFVLQSTPKVQIKSYLKAESHDKSGVLESGTHWLQFTKPSLIESSFWLNAKFCLSNDNNLDVNVLICALLSHDCGLSVYILSDLYEDQNLQFIKTAVDIFEIILLHTSKPHSLALLLLPFIERNNSWNEFDKSRLLNDGYRNWWYRAIEELIIPDVNKYLRSHLSPAINHFIIVSQIPDDIIAIYKSNNLLFYDKNLVIEESYLTILSIVSDLVQSLPFTLIASLEYLNQSMPQSICSVSRSLTLNVLLSCVVRQLKKFDFLSSNNYSYDNYCEIVCQNLLTKLLDVYNNSEKFFKKIKNKIENITMDIKDCGVLNEEKEIAIISSKIDDNINNNQISITSYQELNALVSKYETIINDNLYKVSQNTDEINDLNKNVLKGFDVLEESINECKTLDNYSSIKWDDFKSEIRARIDNRSVLSLLKYSKY